MELSDQQKADICNITQEDEQPIAVLGRDFLRADRAPENLERTVLILTAKRLYQAGPYYMPDSDGKFDKLRGINTFELADLSGVELIDKPVARWIGIVGWILLIGGIAIMAAGFWDGGGAAMAIALFIGPVWMSVPGVLMVVHEKSGAETYLQLSFRDKVVAAAVRKYPDAELAAFKETCAGIMAGNVDLPKGT